MKNPFWRPLSLFVIVILILSGTIMLYPIVAPERNTTAYLIGCLGFLGVMASIIYILRLTAKHKINLIKNIQESNPIIIFEYNKNEWQPFAKAYIKKKYQNGFIEIPLVLLAVLGFLFFIYTREGVELTFILGIGMFLLLGIIVAIRITNLLAFKKALLLKVPKYKTIITRNGIVINNSYLISYNNEDNSVWRCTASNYIGRDCIELTIRQTANYRAQQISFYLLIPKNRIGEKDEILARLTQTLKPRSSN